MGAATVRSKSQNYFSQQVRTRQLLDRIGRIAVYVMLALVAAVYVVAPFRVAYWSKLPNIGVMTEPPLTANVAVSRGTFGNMSTASGMPDLAQNETITAVDGIPVSGIGEYRQVLESRSVGDTVVLTVQAHDGSTREAAVELSAVSPKQILVMFGIPYLIGLVYCTIGLWVYFRRIGNVIGRTFLLFCTGIALVFGTTFDLWTTHTFYRLWLASIPIAASLLLVLTFVFPSELPFVARRPLLRWLPAVFGAAILLIVQFNHNQPHEITIAYWRLEYYFGGLSIIVFLLGMFIRGLLAVSPTVREQSRVVLIGALVSFAPFVVFAVNTTLLPITWVIAAFLLFPLVLAYSIVQYNVLDTNRMASFATTYTVMAAIVLLGYAVLIAGVNVIAVSFFFQTVPATNPLMIAFLAFILVLAFQPLRRRLQSVVDRLFFRSIEMHQERLTEFRHQLTVASGLDEVIRLLKSQIVEGIVPSHVYIFLRDPLSGDFVAVGEGRRPDTDVRFEAGSGLAYALTTAPDVLFLELNKPLPQELVDEHSRLAILRTPLLVPLQGQDRLAGWAAIGGKRSGEVYTVSDLRYVKALTEQASLAVERAQVIGDLERRVRELDVLSQIAQAVNFAADPESLLELIFAQTSKLIDTTNFYIVTDMPEVSGLAYSFFLENDERMPEREGRPWPNSLGLAAEVIRAGRSILTDDYRRACEERGIKPLDNRHFSWMGVPLNAGNRTLGAMIVASYTQDVIFTGEQLKIFNAIADQAATALEKARLFAETETRARQLATLNVISRELSSTLDLEQLLVRITRSAVEIIGTEAGTLYMIDEETGEIVFRVVEGGAQDLIGTRLPPGAGLVGKAASSKKPVIVNDVLQDKDWLSDVDRETEFQTQSLLSVPILAQDQSIGVLQLINRRDGKPFDEDDAELLTTFAAQAAIGIENARLYEATDAELARRVDELQNLQRIDRELNRTLDLDRVIQVTLDWAIRITGASAGMITMLNAEEDGLEILTSRGYRENFLEEYKEKPVSLDVGIVGRVMRLGQPEFVEDVAKDEDFVSTSEEETIAQITVPILRANQPIGALVLESHVAGLLAVQDFEFAQRLVEHAAVAIENARLVKEVQDANRSKTEFISFVAHELKNPMTSIRGYTDLLKGGQVGEINDMQVQFLSTIRSNVDRMTRLVSDLSDTARIETGNMRLDIAPVSVMAIVDDTVRGLKGQIEEKGQELIVDIPDDLPMINADMTRMVQVMTNLLSNAHKYTPENGTIEIHAQPMTDTNSESGEQKEVIHHWVVDTGIGMSEEDLEKLFTKFFRTQRSKDMASGTGLGLNLSRSLVEQHGGRIWVESEVGKGSAFHYTCPVAEEESE